MTMMVTTLMTLLERVDLQKYINILSHTMKGHLQLKKNQEQLVLFIRNVKM